MGHLAVIFAWVAQTFETFEQMHHQAKMTAKYPMDLDVQKLSRVHACDHFDSYMAHFAQGHKKLQQFSFLANCHTQNLSFFRFGPMVRSTYDVSSWKVYNFLRHDVGIKKIHTYWCCTRNPVELEYFECSLVFFSPESANLNGFFSSELITYARLSG